MPESAALRVLVAALNPQQIARLLRKGQNALADREISQILSLWEQIRDAGDDAVLATVIRTQGSSYRLPGARLLLAQDGRRAGSVSGGCLEEDLRRRAWHLTENGPAIRRYDTTADGEIAGQYGLGCNGIIHLSLERLKGGNSSVMEILARVRQSRQAATIEHLATVPGETPFVETVFPPVRLLIFGAGDDAVPLTAMAAQLGWEVHVRDGRAHYARREKFPFATSVTVRVPGDPIPHDTRTVAAIMSHSYTQDLSNLQALVPLHLPYVGLLGPRKRAEQLFAELAEQGVNAGQTDIFGPMGLDLGADGPEQVALAVIAEMQGVLNGRTGGSLRYVRGSIHQCA